MQEISVWKMQRDYICFLDDDDIYLPLTLDFRLTMIKKLEADVVYQGR